MCDFDKASDTEQKQRDAAIEAARHVSYNTPINDKRRKLAEARLLAAQRGPGDPDVQDLGLGCENGCGEQLTVDNDDIFCCKECAEDWQRRATARKICGRPY